MISEEIVRKILESGILAPSGENAQPWLFKIDKNTVSLFNNPDSDQSLYNYRQSGSFVAHGACIENMVIAATEFGLEADIQYFPDDGVPDFVAKISLREGDVKRNLLADSLSRRATNRKSYDGSALTDDERKAFVAVATDAARIVLVEDRIKISALAHAASVNEAMLVENEYVHDFFFSHVRWTPEENEMQPNGFYIKTLELKPPQVAAFKLLSKPSVGKFLKRLGLSRVVRKDNEKIYNTASAMIGIVAKDNSPKSLVLAGRTFERLWLTATKLGLSIQPTTGALFLAESVSGENRENFLKDQQSAILNSRSSIYETLGVEEKKEHVVVLFRIGRGGDPSARAARFPLENFLEESFRTAESSAPRLATDRKALIEHILKDLASIRNNPAFPNQYAIEENIAFFEAIKTVPSYLKWLLTRAPKLDRTQLLELTDFSFPRWDREMHLKLMEVEKRDPPGMVAPLVERLIAIIKDKKKEPFVAVNLGCGGMEVERQIIQKLLDEKYNKQAVFIGVDKSSIVHELARENLHEVEPFIAIHEIEKLDQPTLDRLLGSNEDRHTVIFAKNDIFGLSQEFRPSSFDIIYHTLFKHHLTDDQKTSLDSTMAVLGRHTLEYDGYKNWFITIPQTFVGWGAPSFLNAELFSNFRFFSKKELQEMNSGRKISFYPSTGTYLME
jgi:nitroreductase